MVRLIRHLGFQFVRQKGSHAYYRHSDGRATVVPMHRGEDLGRGLIRTILRDVEITPEEFLRLLREV
ncbi:MAG: type II toxin-antitoxin system HicA family toxin [Elusimicrobiota bacterium]